MKNLLLKHGITPEILSTDELFCFECFLQSARDGDMSEFKLFLASVNKKLNGSAQSLTDCKERLLAIISDAENALEHASDTVSGSLFSAFRTRNAADAEERHCELIRKLAQALCDLTELQLDCAREIENANFAKATELKLREIALAEFGHDEMRGAFSDALQRLATDRQGSFIEFNDSINRAKDEISKLCGESEKAFSAIEGGSPSAYSQMLRISMTALHSLALNIK